MSKPEGHFSRKHGEGNSPSPEIRDEILRRVSGGEVPCAVAFAIARQLAVDPAEVGKTVDLLEHRLVKCQMGLFGYQPEKKIVRPADAVSPALAEAIEASLEKKRISCRTAWQIADRLGLRKMAVSSACETLGVKIKPCQLGAF